MLGSVMVPLGLGIVMVLARSVAPIVITWLALRTCPPELRAGVLVALAPSLAALRRHGRPGARPCTGAGRGGVPDRQG